MNDSGKLESAVPCGTMRNSPLLNFPTGFVAELILAILHIDRLEMSLGIRY
jgi:hypothetical protein